MNSAGLPELPLDGGCRCGRITYRVTQAPKFSFACHCTDCQTLSASAFSMALAVADEAFMLEGTPRIWAKKAESGHMASNFTCPDCTTWLFTRTESAPGVTIVRPGSLKDHRWFRPVAQIFTRSALPWALLAVPLNYETEFKDTAPLAKVFEAAAVKWAR
jgi:hypothetical protein